MMRQKTALITGAARGIGLATARLMSERNYKVAMIDRDGDELKAVVSSLNQAKSFFCDVSIPEDVEKMINGVMNWAGQINVVVNNAGVADFGPIEDIDFERWRKVMATNLDGVFLVSQACISLSRACAH